METNPDLHPEPPVEPLKETLTIAHSNEGETSTTKYPDRLVNGHWINCPEFFDKRVQSSLFRLHKALTEKGCRAGATIGIWRALFHSTQPDKTNDEFGIPGLLFEWSADQKVQFWGHLYGAYMLAPVETSELISVVTRFHSKSPREWIVGAKIILATQLGNGQPVQQKDRPAPEPDSKELSDQMKRLFGLTMTNDYCRKALHLERSRREEIHAFWAVELAEPLPPILNTHFC